MFIQISYGSQDTKNQHPVIKWLNSLNEDEAPLSSRGKQETIKKELSRSGYPRSE